jgi:glucokinase-like ROK family protein
VIAITQKATRAQTKSHNKTLILKTIYDQEKISRAMVARQTRLTRPTVSRTVSELIEEGLVVEVGQGPSKGGKPPILLSVAPNSRHLIGIDLANSEFRGAVIDLRGNIIHRETWPVNERDGDVALQMVYELIDRLIVAATSPILGIGIGTPGLMNPEAGTVRIAVNLDWKNLPLRDILETRYNLPVYIANDSQVAALGEYTFGGNRDSSNLIVVKIGRGLGAGIVINGHLHYGDGYGAGEIGHIKAVATGGERCRCGLYGCLETVVGSRTLVNRARHLMRTNPQSTLHQFTASPEALNTDLVIQAFKTGCNELYPIINEMGQYLGAAIANLVGILNIRHILIGGSLARLGEVWLAPISRETRQRVQATQADETVVGIANLGSDIVIFGAAALLLAHELELV